MKLINAKKWNNGKKWIQINEWEKLMKKKHEFKMYTNNRMQNDKILIGKKWMKNYRKKIKRKWMRKMNNKWMKSNHKYYLM